MSQVERAVWFIESHYAEPIGLDDIARACGSSRSHLARTFGQVTGQSMATYLRGRRLTHAAHALANGGTDILSVALSVGYGSHEAFTRAFSAWFGVTPESVRKGRDLSALSVLEPLDMTSQETTTLPSPEIREAGPLLLVGTRQFYTYETRIHIPAQWQRFAPHIGNIPGQSYGDAYGVCFPVVDRDDGFDYMAAVPVSSLDALPEGLTGARVARHRYAVFKHDAHISTIGATCAALFSDWLPTSGHAFPDGPVTMIEHYDKTFDSQTGRGGIFLWIPIQSA